MSTSYAHPNYVNPPLAGHAMEPLGVFLIVMSTIIVALRLYTRLFIIRATKRDDWLILPALVFAIICTISGIQVAKYGFGRHAWDVPSDYWSPLFFYSWLTTIDFTIALTLTKLSILNVYLRLTVPGHGFTLQRWIYIMITFIAAWGALMVILNIFQCYPVHNIWTNPPGVFAHCAPQKAVTVVYFLNSVVNTLTDLVIFFMPVGLIWALKMSTRQKCGLIALFGAGGLGIVAGILRLAFVVMTRGKGDATWKAYWLILFVILEIHVGIICASIPALKPLFIKAQIKLVTTVAELERPRKLCIHMSRRFTMKFTAAATMEKIGLPVDNQLPAVPSRAERVIKSVLGTFGRIVRREG